MKGPKHCKNSSPDSMHTEKMIWELPGETSARSPSRHVTATFGNCCAHEPIEATVSAANLLSGSLT